MKKVLVVSAALALLAGPELGSATIRNSAHDLSSSSAYTRQVSGDDNGDASFDQLCAYCHTPHKANLSVATAPLWNRFNPTEDTVKAYSFYNTATLSEVAQPRNVKNTVYSTDVPLCMSCHDNTSLTNNFINPVGDAEYGSDAKKLTIAPIHADSTALLLDGAGGANSLMNDHPVGFNYDTAYTQDGGATGGLVLRATATTAKKVAFYGTNSDMMWCSSCHAVHEPGTDGAGTYPFLRSSVNGSELCLTCHNK